MVVFKVFSKVGKLVSGGLGGILVAVLIIAGFAWMGFLPTANATGRLVVKIKDAPASLEELNINHRRGESA